MVSFAEIVVVAFVAQLAVLPGEKVQFIIAGLSTRYSPLVVVSAAGTAFAGWTALEIWLGEALQTAFPSAVLDGVSALLFAVFAVLLWRSAPDDHATPSEVAAETDGGLATSPDIDLPTVAGYDLSNAAGGFLPIFVMMAVGEFGDKTQLVTIGLAIQYGASPAIWVGEMLAIIPVSLANAYLFHRFSHRFDLERAHQFAAALFAFFAADTVLALTTGFSVWETVVGSVADAVLSVA
ncbi:Putative Ca2+/H+ antiporter, TMEM165/GDT1 family [Halogranum gelatinilyticum]|uniref:Putative Ca2+/H+ antiporter, TMEM165/GDT1 family n=1 Tax=Halogranum gelatinilyticum TaxID=660521 RepID=A0A1G9QMQ8_9EURY|nr:TMEM165/GDT1 family protein [Halogranum gelatinilyticum]SDM12111.1 Putative Ca2+/H+ antiporter, TMEM165/GDT1 family [Halogranum gelatinilyticum]